MILLLLRSSSITNTATQCQYPHPERGPLITSSSNNDIDTSIINTNDSGNTNDSVSDINNTYVSGRTNVNVSGRTNVTINDSTMCKNSNHTNVKHRCTKPLHYVQWHLALRASGALCTLQVHTPPYRW